MFASMPLTLAVGSVLVLAAASVLALLLRGSSAASRYVVWSAAMITLLALPILSAALPAWHVLPAADTAMPPLAEVPVFSVEVVESVPTFEVHGHAPVAESTALWPWAVTLIVVWGLGVALLMSVPLVGWWRLKRLEHQCKPVADEHWQRLLNDARRQIGIARSVTLLRCEERLMPMTWGIARPRILVPGIPGVPVDADGWTDSRKKVVLLHELAHIKRLDVLTHLLAQLARALYWFNPLAWLAVGQMRRERERACDDLVLSLGTRGPDYAGHLVEVAMPSPTFGRASFAAVAMPMARSSRLEGRVRDILDARRPRKAMSTRGVLAMLGLMLLIALPVASIKQADGADEPKAVADASPSEGPKHFVRLVVGQDSMTFQGQKTTWDELPRLLEKVPNRAETVLEFAIASEETTIRELNDITARAAAYARTHGFQYPSYVGVEPAAPAPAPAPGSGATSAASSKRQRFVPQEDMAEKTSWTMMDKPSPFNPNGWAVMARIALGGIVPVKLPDEPGERFRMQMIEGDDDAITLRLARDNIQPVTLVIERDRSRETEFDGRRYRIRYSSVEVKADQPDTNPLAHIFLTPVDSTQEPGTGKAPTSRMEEALRKRVPVQFDANRLENVIDYFRNVTGLDILVQWKTLESMGVDASAPVTLNLSQPQFGTALRAVLDSLTAEPGLISFAVQDDMIVISTADALRQAAARVSPVGSKGASNAAIDHAGRQRTTSRADEALRKRVPVQFDANRLENVIDYFRNVTGLDIVVQWKTLEAAGMDASEPVTLNLSQPQFGAALRAVLDSLTAEPGLIDFTVQDDIIFISTAAALRQAAERSKPAEPKEAKPGPDDQKEPRTETDHTDLLADLLKTRESAERLAKSGRMSRQQLLEGDIAVAEARAAIAASEGDLNEARAQKQNVIKAREEILAQLQLQFDAGRGDGAALLDAQSKLLQARVAADNDTQRPAEVKNRTAAPKGWEESFYATYRLDESEVVRRIAPPFIPERAEYYRAKHRSQAEGIPEPPDYFTFHWRDGKAHNWGLGFVAGRHSLRGVLTSNLGLESYEFEGDAALMDMHVPGDWIVRESAGTAERLAALERILERDLGRRIRFEHRQVERDVLVVSGKFEPDYLKGTHHDGWVHIYAEKLDPNESAGGGSGSVQRFVTQVGNHLNLPVDFGGAQAVDATISWGNHFDSYWRRIGDRRDELINKTLANLSQQTGLTFERERRPVKVWFVVE